MRRQFVFLFDLASLDNFLEGSFGEKSLDRASGNPEFAPFSPLQRWQAKSVAAKNLMVERKPAKRRRKIDFSMKVKPAEGRPWTHDRSEAPCVDLAQLADRQIRSFFGRLEPEPRKSSTSEEADPSVATMASSENLSSPAKENGFAGLTELFSGPEISNFRRPLSLRRRRRSD